MIRKKEITSLSKKATAIFAAALASLTSVDAKVTASPQDDNFQSGMIQVKEFGKTKPMPILKLNMGNPEDSQFVASHTSHRSHSSHRSHASHRSGAMFI